MTDREKVAKAIRCRLKRDCSSCPYDEDFNCLGCEIWMWKALELLEEQRPRVLTLEEMRSKPAGDYVWLEVRDDDSVDVQIPDADTIVVVYGVGDGVFGLAIEDASVQSEYIRFCGPSLDPVMQWCDYRKVWRCWSARPTDEQRKAVQWDAAD